MSEVMKQLMAIALFALCGLTLSGCGGSPELLRATGKILKDGETFIPEDDENLQVCFIPISDDGTPPRNWYAAEVDQTQGTFYAAGGEKKGMPPGKYRVMVELKKDRKDLFKGKFDALNSPFVFEIDETSEPMVIDLAGI